MKKRLLLYIVYFSNIHLWFNNLNQSLTSIRDTLSHIVKPIQTIIYFNNLLWHSYKNYKRFSLNKRPILSNISYRHIDKEIFE